MKDHILIGDGAVTWDKNPILFFRKDTIKKDDDYFSEKDITIQKTDCGWTFQLPAINKPDVLGMMIPAHLHEVIIDNNPLDLYKSKRYYYSPSRELERILKINPHDFNNMETPIIHMVNENEAFAWSCPNECIVSSFIYQHKWYVNFEAIAWEDKITFFLDCSSNMLINLQRYPPLKKEILINETTSLKEMQQALLTGSKPRDHPNHPHALIREARSVQLELKKRNLDSVIIGSLARRFNSVPVDVNDIDLMVRDKDQLHGAIDVLESFTDRISLHDSHAKFQHQNCTIDVCYDNFNILPGTDYIISKHGLSYLTTEGLLWLYMTNLFACEMDEHSDDYRNHVNNAITSLYRTHKFGEFDLIPYGSVIPDYSKICFKLCKTLSEAKLEYRDIRINKPFLIRSFRIEDNFFYSIVNLGSCCDAEVVIDQTPSEVIWSDISGEVKSIKPIHHQNFSVVNIPQVSFPGILQCQRLQ